MSEPHKSRLAATVILLRPNERNGFELFLTRRPDGMRLLGGMYSFPGGAVRKDDCSAAMARCCRGLSPGDARKIVGAHFSPSDALGLWVAGIRELFEEVGILLAVNKSGQAWEAGQSRRGLADQHAALVKETLSFRSLLESEELLCDLSSLVYFSHWQTAEQVSIRFDTRFFLAVLPADQIPLSTSAEVADSLWLTPDRALELFAEDQLPMIFPTFASIRTLADFESLDSLWTEYERNPSAVSKTDAIRR
jgi:8-oxo-dGTP pyrophosphatase MutT (NUDIX family)